MGNSSKKNRIMISLTILILGILVFIIIFLRRIIGLLLLLVPLRLYNQKAKKSSFIEQKKQTNVENIHLETTTANTFKGLIINYLNGLNRYCDFQCGRIPSHRIRNFMYRNIWLIDMAPKTVVYCGAEIRAGYNLTIGEGSIIGDNALLDARQKITIGKNVNFSSRVSIYTEDHDHGDPYFRGNCDSSYRVKIDDRVWIGPNVIILHSVHIGEGAVVAAGSIVTKNVPSFSIVAGIPAKVIGERKRDLRYNFDGSHLPFY